jgi:hypothetical protein
MVYISVKQAVRSLQSAKQQLSDKQFATAISRAINESILQGRTEARSSVKALYNIPQRYLSGINVTKATSLLLTARLFASAQPIPMDAFSPKFETATQSLSITKRGQQKQRTFKKAKANPGAGVSIEVIKGKREIIPFAFLIPGAKPRVFARGEYKTGGGSYGFIQRHQRLNSSGSDTPVKPLLSVTVHAAVINKESLERIQTRVNTVFPVSIERNISFLLSGVGT